MRHNIIILAIYTILFSAILSCSSEDSKEIKEDNDKIEHKDDSLNLNLLESDAIEGKDSVSSNEIEIEIIESKYICPLGDTEGNSDKEGVCPVCEMELIENPDYKNIK